MAFLQITQLTNYIRLLEARNAELEMAAAVTTSVSVDRTANDPPVDNYSYADSVDSICESMADTTPDESVMPDWNSDQFYDNYWEDSTMNDTTRRNYERLLDKVDPFSKESVDKWLSDATSLGEKKTRLTLVKRLNDYFEWEEEAINKAIDDLTNSFKSGENMTKKSDEVFDTEYDAIAKNIEKLTDDPSGAIDIWTLFGQLLPPRRMDVFRIVITDKNDGSNYYNRNTGTFTFNKFKGWEKKGTQSYPLDTETFPFLPVNTVVRVKEYLDGLSVGSSIFPQYTGDDHYSRTIKRKTGYNNNSFRHYWARYGRLEISDKKSYLKLCDWMCHSPGTSIVTYS